MMQADRLHDAELDDTVVQSWWKLAQELGEENYVAKYTVILHDAKNASLSAPLLLIASERYPTLLPGFYRALLKSSLASWEVADAIMACDLISRVEKIELFQAAVATNNQAHRNTALQCLREIAPELSDAELLNLLQSATGTAAKQYWSDQDCNLGRQVARCENLAADDRRRASSSHETTFISCAVLLVTVIGIAFAGRKRVPT